MANPKKQFLYLSFLCFFAFVGFFFWLTSNPPPDSQPERDHPAYDTASKEPETTNPATNHPGSETLTIPPPVSPPALSDGLGGFPRKEHWEEAHIVDSGHSLPHFVERKSLEILTNRVAVFSSRIDSGDSPPGFEALRFSGIREEDTIGHPIAGWSIAQTVNALGENTGPDAVDRISTLVREISAGEGDSTFSSPVFRDPERGGLLVATPVILLGFKDGVSLPDRLETVASIPDIDAAVGNLEIDLASPYVKIPVKTARTAFQIFDWVNTLATHSSVLFVEPDMIFEGVGQLIPNDPEFGVCWGLRNTGQSGGQVDFDMDADQAWDLTTGSPSVKVLIIDTGVQQNHPDINQLTGKDFTSESGTSPNGGPVNQYDRHGTPVAGAVSAIMNNSTGSVGVAPGVKSISARCFISTNSSGSWNATYSWTADAVNWAAGQGVRVTNNSNYYGGSSAAIEASYLSTKNNGMIHFASAGNNGSASLSYPASLSTVHGIAASERGGGKASFSQYGTGVGFIAPGASIRLPDRTGADGYNSGDVATMNGTSFASPYSAGVAALVLSVAPGLTASGVDSILEASCVDLGSPGYDTTYGWGHVNALAAVNLALQQADDAYEENDTRTTAYDLSSNVWVWLQSISGLGSQGDDDWFQITSPVGSPRISIDCDFAHSGGDINIGLYDNSGNVIGTSASNTDNEYLDLLVPASGTYFIRVFGADADNAYDLRWRHRPMPILTIDISEVELPSTFSSSSIQVSSNDSWTWSKSSGSSWINTSESTSQSGNQTFSLSVSANSSVQPRTGVITFENGFQTVTHTVTQLGVPPTLDLGDPGESFSQAGGSHNFSVSSNTTWTWSATSGGEWLNSTETSPQSETQTFSYALDANPEIQPRQIVLEFTNGTQTRLHTITQAGVPPEVVTDLTATQMGGSTIDLSWTAANSATEYQIWRGTSATFNSMSLVATTTETTFADSELNSGQNYYYRIVSENVNASSASSSQAAGKLFGNLDAMGQRPGRAALYGDDIYNTLTGQSVVYRTKKKGAAKYRLYLENESDTGSEIVGAQSGKGNRKFSVKYTSAYAGGANVTATMTTGRYLARSSTETSEVVSVVVKPSRKTKSKRGAISLLSRSWMHELPESTDLVKFLHKKTR